MTVSEMHIAFRLQLDKSTSLVGSPDFLPEEIDFWLNEAQERFVKQRLFGNNFKKEGFEDSIKRIEDLRTLIVLSTNNALSNTTLNISNTKQINLFANFAYLIRISLKDVSGNVQHGFDVIKHKDAYKYFVDSINYPFIKRPLSMIEGTILIIIHDPDYTPTTVDVEYIRMPLKLTSFTPNTGETNTCELTVTTHREIVVLAASLAIENIESNRTQTFTQLNVSNVE